MKRRKGFTLAELLVVVAIIAVLVAISIAIFTSQLHKAEVATDWANIRSYYSEIQTDYITTGKYNPKVTFSYETKEYVFHEITYLNGNKVKLKAGYFAITQNGNKGYQIVYRCEKGHTDCTLTLNVSNS